MLKLIVLGEEYFNEETNEFHTEGDFVIELEHSLLSLSKWESKHQKPFLGSGERTNEELISYFEAMVVTPETPSDLFKRLSKENIDAISSYIESKESATTFGTMPQTRGRGEVITSELIYYWLVAYSIPFEVEHWHLNRLLSLVRICNMKNQKPQKMSRNELAQRNRDLNAQRRAKYNTSG